MQQSSSLQTFLAELVGFPTQTGDGPPNEACLTYCENRLTTAGLHINRHQNNGFSSLVATTQPTKRPKVMLSAHLDVVPAPESAFTMREAEGKLLGRGVYDMKFAAACYLQLVSDLQADLASYDFGIMFTTDEEIGGNDGAAVLLNEEGYGAEVCVLPDGGDDWQIETTSNGGWIVRLSASGKTAHGSRPWEGDNAIEAIIAALSDIKAVFGPAEDRNSSLTISRIEGGQAFNQVPDNAQAYLDMRFHDADLYAEMRQQVEATVDRHKLQLETIAVFEACQTDVTQPHVASFLKLAEQQLGREIGQCHSFGSSDARFFAAHDIPTIVIRPTGGGAHSDEEWIDQTALQQFYEILEAYVIQTARIA